jgi:hypothetical protein
MGYIVVGRDCRKSIWHNDWHRDSASVRLRFCP